MANTHSTDVCIVGGGPAGMVLALLLAHRGIKTLVLEKNADFSREYRGEVLMPRFTQLMRQVGLADWLLTLKHLKLKRGELYFLNHSVGAFNFTRLCPDVPYALWMPQVVLLNGLHAKAKEFSAFDIWFGTAAKSLIQKNGTVHGISVQKGGETIDISAKVVVGADGRYSTVLKDGGFEIEYENYNFDILWFTIPRPKDYENTFKVMFAPKRSFLFLPKYPDEIQVGILVEPKQLAELRERGIEPLRQELRDASPLFKDFADNLKDFTPFHPLQAVLHYVKDWAKDGCVLIGDAAHCCSPAGAIGVSMAVGTAIMTAEVLSKAIPQSSGVVSKRDLDKIQKTVGDDVRNVHRVQRSVTGGGLNRLIPIRWLLPLMVTLIARTPLFRRLQSQLVTLPKPLPLSRELSL